MIYNRFRMSRIFPWEDRWIWGSLLVFSLAPSMVANYAGAAGQTVSAIFFAGFVLAFVVSLIFDPRARKARSKPNA